ncbi:hypothetical protein ACNKTV_004741 [Vibrio parahaemolyticus]
MLKLINKIFGKKTNSAKKSNSSLPVIKVPKLEELFFKHFNDLPYFKEKSFEIVLKHLKHEIDLNKSGRKLTAIEKKDLGLNARLSITSDLVAVLSEKGLQLPDPKIALKQVYYRATFEVTRIEKFQQMLSVGFTTAIYKSCRDERDCAWCKENDGVKFTVSEDLNTELNQNCTCDWNRGFFAPEANFRK